MRLPDYAINANNERVNELGEILGAEFNGITIVSGSETLRAEGITVPRSVALYINTSGTNWTLHESVIHGDGEIQLSERAHVGIKMAPLLKSLLEAFNKKTFLYFYSCKNGRMFFVCKGSHRLLNKGMIENHEVISRKR